MKMKIKMKMSWVIVLLCGFMCGCTSTTIHRQQSVYMRVKPATERNAYVIDFAEIKGVWNLQDIKTENMSLVLAESWVEKFPELFEKAKSGTFTTTNSTLEYVALPTLRVMANEWGDVVQEPRKSPRRYTQLDVAISYRDGAMFLKPPKYNGNVLRVKCEPDRGKTRAHGVYIDVAKGVVQNIHYFDVNFTGSEWVRILDVRQVEKK